MKYQTAKKRLTLLTPLILLVDDDEIDTEMVTRAFRLQNAENRLICAENGLVALELLRGIPGTARLPKPYIILLDINMPRMNGLEFLHELRLDPQLKDSVVFVLTTSTRPEDKIAAYDACVAGYILKQNVGYDFGNGMRFLDGYQSVIYLPS